MAASRCGCEVARARSRMPFRRWTWSGVNPRAEAMSRISAAPPGRIMSIMAPICIPPICMPPMPIPPEAAAGWRGVPCMSCMGCPAGGREDGGC